MNRNKYIATVVVAFFAACLLLAAPSFAGEMLDVNTATAEQLEEIKGVGEKTAKAIVEYREDHGSFASLDDLIQVKGIGEKKLAAMREHLTVGANNPCNPCTPK